MAMKWVIIICHALSLAFAAGRILEHTNQLLLNVSPNAVTEDSNVPLLHEILPSHPQEDHSLSKRALDVDAIWYKAVCAGQKLFQAMTTNADTADRFITPVKSDFDGYMFKEMEAWGYDDFRDRMDPLCNFEHHSISRALTALGIDRRSGRTGGPNWCFHVSHKDGPIVHWGPGGGRPRPISQTYTGPDGRLYRVTGAYATIGVNPVSGVLYFINRNSPVNAAKALWGDRPNQPPQSNELPLLRSSSDIAWAFWNRASAANLKNIQYIMALNVANEETTAIIKCALKYLQPPGHIGEPSIPSWPGMTFNLNGDEDGMALLGSPNGIGAGYFLAQHKAQLGGNKVITRITVFTDVDEEDMPQMLFWVGERPLGDGAEGAMNNGSDVGAESRVVERSKDGKEMLREHIFRARL